MPFTRLDEHVDMIGHDAPFDEALPIPIEVEKRILYERGNAGIAQIALALPLILVLFDKATKRLCFILLFGGEIVQAKLLTPLLKERGGHAVVESKIDALQQSALVEVREIAAGVPALVDWLWNLFGGMRVGSPRTLGSVIAGRMIHMRAPALAD